MALMTPCAVDTQWAMVTLLPPLSGSHPEQVCDEVHEHLQDPVQGAQPCHVDGDGAQVGDLTTRGKLLSTTTPLDSYDSVSTAKIKI